MKNKELTTEEKKKFQEIARKELDDNPSSFIPSKKEIKEFDIIIEKLNASKIPDFYYNMDLERELMYKLYKKFKIKEYADRLRITMRFTMYRTNYFKNKEEL